MAGLKSDRYAPAFWEINGVDLAKLGETKAAAAHEFIVRICFPPLETCEEVNHVGIALEHGHGVVAAAVYPAAASVGPHVCSTPGGFTGGLVTACHNDFPSRPA